MTTKSRGDLRECNFYLFFHWGILWIQCVTWVQSTLGQQEKENQKNVDGKMALGFLFDRKEDGVAWIWEKPSGYAAIDKKSVVVTGHPFARVFRSVTMSCFMAYVRFLRFCKWLYALNRATMETPLLHVIESNKFLFNRKIDSIKKLLFIVIQIKRTEIIFNNRIF